MIKRDYINIMVILNFDAIADFGRLYPAYSNMLDAKKNIDQTICEYISATIEEATRSTETGVWGLRHNTQTTQRRAEDDRQDSRGSECLPEIKPPERPADKHLQQVANTLRSHVVLGC